jgi:Tol biopolymer transport system component
MRCRPALALVLFVPIALVGAGTSAAPATTATTGRIVFTSNRYGGNEIYAANPDGTGLTQLTHVGEVDASSPPLPSPNGKLIAVGSTVTNADGSVRRVLHGCSGADTPSWSPDSTRLVCRASGGEGLAVAAVGTGTVTPLTPKGAGPAWSPDGRSIAFSDEGLWVVPAGGGATRRLGRRQVGFEARPSWSPDSRRLAYAGAAGGASSRTDLFTIGADGSGERLLVKNVDETENPQWSPDGSWIAFAKPTTRTGEAVHLVRPNGSGLHALDPSAREASTSPSWSADGTRLLYARSRYRYDLESDVFVASPRGGPGRAVTRPFPDGGTNEDPVWDPGPSLTTPPRPLPRTLALPRPRTLTFSGFDVEGPPPAVVADGARAAVADESCGALVWEPLRHRMRRMRKLCSEPTLSDIVLAGPRLAWLLRTNGNTEEHTELWTARIGAGARTGVTGASDFSDSGSSTHETGGRLYALRGGGGTIAFTFSRYGRAERRRAWLLLTQRGSKCPHGSWKAKSLCRRLPGAKDGVTSAVDAHRVLTVSPGGIARLVATSGRLLRQWTLGRGIAAVRLQGRTLAVQRGAMLALYDTATGSKIRTRRLVSDEGAGPALLDVQGNLAVYGTGGAIHVLRLSDGRDLALALPGAAPPLDAQVEPSGLFVLWNRMYARRSGRLTFVPLRALERAIQGRPARSAY